MIVAIQDRKGGDPDGDVEKGVGTSRSKLGGGSLGNDTGSNGTATVLPQGKELSDAQLEKTDSEGVITALFGLAVGAGTEYARERICGEKPNLRER